MIRILVWLAALSSLAGCGLSPASPTQTAANTPKPTMIAFPATVEVARFTSGTAFYYQACTEISNPLQSSNVSLEKMEFYPIDADGTTYAPLGIVGGYSVAAGRTDSRCWSFNEFNVVRAAPTRYRLKFTYYTSDSTSLFSIEAASTLTSTPSRF